MKTDVVEEIENLCAFFRVKGYCAVDLGHCKRIVGVKDKKLLVRKRRLEYIGKENRRGTMPGKSRVWGQICPSP